MAIDYGLEDQSAVKYMFSGLRKAWRWSKSYRECRKRAWRRKEDKAGKWTDIYGCELCSSDCWGKNAHVDHIKPVGAFVNWLVYVVRLFCASTNLQLLCSACHKVKTKKEAGERAKARKIRGS